MVLCSREQRDRDKTVERGKRDTYEFLAIGLCAPVDEQRALLDKVPGQVEDLLNLVAHLDGVVLLF